MVSYIPISIIPRPKLSIEFVPKKIQNSVGVYNYSKLYDDQKYLIVGIEIPPVIEISISKNFTINTVNHNDSVSDINLIVEFDGQHVFNVFSNPSLHALIINGVEYHEYYITNISNNWKLFWENIFNLSTTDKVIFRTFNS